MANETLKVIEARNSVRAYTDEKLTCEEVKAVITAGLQAPTAANKQELHFSVLEDGNPVLEEIAYETKKSFHPEMTEEELKVAKNFYYSAPVVVIVTGDKNFGWSALDAGIAVENMSLAAQSMGLGNLIIGCIKGVMNGEKGADFLNKIGAPENYEYYIAFAFGHASAEKTPHTYDEARDVTFVK